MATYQHTFLVFNPQAGALRRGGDRALLRLLAVLQQEGLRVTPVPTRGPQTAGGIARDCLQKGADLLLVAGGDGTVNEVINGMVGSPVPVGVLPGGTANVLARELGLPKRMEHAAREIRSWMPRRIALGRLENHQGTRYFLLMAGIGLDAHIVYHLNASLKTAIGKLAYWVGGFSMVGRPLPEFDCRVAERSLPASFALVSRVANYGGDLEIARGAHLLAEDFEMMLFSGRQAKRYLRYFTSILLNRTGSCAGITTVRSQGGEFSRSDDGDQPVYVQTDGEYAGGLPARISIEPDSLTLLMPLRYQQRYG